MSMPTRDCPSRLYKYFGPERIDILERGIIRYSPLGAFNDPFEGRPEITNLSTEADLAKTFADIFPRTIEENYALLPPQAQKAIPLESFKSMLMTKFQTTQNEFFRQVQTFTPLLKTFFSKKFDEHIGALC